MTAALAELRLLHLADSALPIGALAHSFGLESLVAAELLGAGDLSEFLCAYLEEAGFAEAVFCRQAFLLATANLDSRAADFRECWLSLNARLSAFKPSREGRDASASLGRNFLRVVAALSPSPLVREALDCVSATGAPPSSSGGAAHHCTAFGLAAAVLDFPEGAAISAYLHQCAAGLVSVCQRLLPLGQTEAARILWNLKPAILDAVARASRSLVADVRCFTPLLDWAAMEHPALPTRLFIS
ncbi:MAG TPA: urease accessory UreF family protein [Candidatus Acidoferrales bacterium]|nr:urease accessory UreF family protein [Candidatus Acidoferrales bacterium]